MPEYLRNLFTPVKMVASQGLSERGFKGAVAAWWGPRGWGAGEVVWGVICGGGRPEADRRPRRIP